MKTCTWRWAITLAVTLGATAGSALAQRGGRGGGRGGGIGGMLGGGRGSGPGRGPAATDPNAFFGEWAEMVEVTKLDASQKQALGKALEARANALKECDKASSNKQLLAGVQDGIVAKVLTDEQKKNLPEGFKNLTAPTKEDAQAKP